MPLRDLSHASVNLNRVNSSCVT